MAEKKKYNSILISGRKDQTLTYSKYVKDEESGESVKESLDKKVNITDELTTQQIKDGAITNEKMSADSVGNTNLQDGSVSNEKLESGSITNDKLADNSITKDKLKDNTIGVEKLDNELRQAIAAATGLPENLVETIQNVDDTLKDHQSQLDDKQSQIDDKQQQITANDEDISLLQTRSTQMEETIKSIAATGGASQATAVTYDNEKSGLTAVNAQAAIDEVDSKLSDLALIKDSVSSLVTKTETIKKESGESLTFIWTHQYFKKGTRLQLVVENPNGNVSELIQISVYSVKTDGNLGDGYATIVENYRTVTDNKFVLNIVFPADGYLFFNWGDEPIRDNNTLTCRYTVYGSLSQGLEDAGKALEKTRNEISKLVSAVPVLQEEVNKHTSSDAIDGWTHLYFFKGTRLHLEVSTIVGDISDLIQLSAYSVKTDGNLDDGYETIIENFQEIKNDKFIIDIEYPKDGYLFFNLGHYNSLIGKEITIKYAVYATISQNNVKQEFFSTKDAISSLVTKTDSLTKESNQSYVPMYTHLYFKKGARLQLVVENPNGNVSELIQISVYSVKTDGNLGDGYAAIVENYRTVTDNKFVLNIVFPADGYLFFNWGDNIIIDNDTLTCKYTLYGSLSQGLEDAGKALENTRNEISKLVSAVPVLQEEVKKRTSSDAIDAWTHLYFYKGTRLHLEVSTIVGDISDLVQMSVYSVKTDGNLGDGYETIIEGFNDIKNGKYIIDIEYPKDGYLFFNLGHNNSLIGKEITIKYAVYATISQNNVKQEFFSTKDAISSLVTKTDSLTKESNQSYVPMYTHLYFKKGARLQLVVENPNGNVSELIQISVYSVKTDGNLGDGYAAIVENYRTVTDNKFVLNIVFPADGYLFFNWGDNIIIDNDTLTCKYTLYGSLSQGLEDAGKALENTRNEISKLVSAVPVLQEEVKKRTSSDAIDAWTHLYFYKGTRLHLEVSTIVGDISDLVQMSVYSVKTDGNLGDGYETIIEGFNDIKNGKYIIDIEYPKDGYLFFNLGHNNSLIGKEITIKYAVYATISQNNVKQEFFSTKDAISSLVTKTDSLTKESNQSYVPMYTHLYFKKGARLQLVVENPNGNASELIQISAYSIDEDNKVEAGHYTKIVENYRTVTDNKFVLNIVFPADGYLFFNWGGEPIRDNNTLTCRYTVYGSLSQEVSNLNTKVEGLNTKVEELSITKELNNIQKAISVLHNVNILDILSPVNDNIYINVVGDSIMAFQSSNIIADEGVTNVPPTCDKKANCYFLWKAISWGDCKYARFDKGKKSLVGQWDNTISDDSAAFFTENGTFKTEYIGATMRDKFPQIDGIQVSTIINAKSFPYQFDESENGWWQRNIPKRFSNEANASVSFVIPKGYKYFDFLYHAHIHGDNNVTIAISNGKKVKICTNFENDFSLKENISNYTLDTSYTPTGDHDDKYGVPNQRLHFEIEDVSTDTVVTITKSNDTSKYFIYWGISYWGTELSPYSLQINNFAIGGYGVESVNAIRESMFKGTYCDGIILEVCANTVCATRNVLSYIQSYFTEYKDCLNKEHPYKIDIQKVGVWIPHLWNKNFENSEVKSISYINNKGACKIVKDLGYNLLFNIQNVFDSVRLLYSPNVSEKDFINQYDGGNGVHLNTDGYKIYFPVWKSII